MLYYICNKLEKYYYIKGGIINMNNFRAYLKEIGRHPLLTAQEEKDLAYRMREGDAAAREKLIVCNLRLVVNIAKGYRNNHLSIMDLVSEGNTGLMTAVDKFNPDLGYRFSTCATPWIKQAISKAITDKGRNIRIPAHIYHLLSKYRKVESELQADGHKVTDEEMARALNVEIDKIQLLKEWMHDTVSMETPLGADADETIGDMVPDHNMETPDKYTERRMTHDKIMKVIGTLKPRTQEIIKLRYGLANPGDPEIYRHEHTLEEIGDIVGITRERVRQIEKQALAEMKLIWDRV